MAMEISNVYSSYAGNSAYAAKSNNQKKTMENNGFTFVAANYQKGMRYGTMATTNIAISPQFLKKMADNPELEKEYKSYFEGMRKLDQENIRIHEARGRRMVAQGWAIDKNGGISRWGISEPTNKRHYGQEMTDYANKIREQKLEKKQEQAKIEEKHQANVTGLNMDLKA